MDLNKAIGSIEKQIKEYVGERKAVIGLSGGIDSSVIAYLCVRALGRENVLGISMPCRDPENGKLDVSSDDSIGDAYCVAQELNIEFLVRNIALAVKAFSDFEGGDMQDLTLGNIMARVRMVTLYMYANGFNGMVIGTTNKTEAAIGYYTKYGDGAVDVEPIADVYKTEVWEIAKIIGVPQKIIDKKPSAELWEGHSDEDEIGMTYGKMDEILIGMEKNSLEASGVYIPIEESYGRESVERVRGLVKNSEHKRHMPPAFKVRDDI